MTQLPRKTGKESAKQAGVMIYDDNGPLFSMGGSYQELALRSDIPAPATYGTMANQDADSVNIDGGTISGVTIAGSTWNNGTISGVTIAGATWNNGTISGATINGADINGGSIDNTPIGATTRSTGRFTTIHANGNVQISGNLTVSGNLNVSGTIMVGNGKLVVGGQEFATYANGITVGGNWIAHG